MLHAIEFLILATVVHAFIGFMLGSFALSYTTPTLAWTLWAAIALITFHWIRLAGHTIRTLAQPR